MVQIQVEVPDHTEKQLRIWMAFNDVRSKTEAINIILDRYFIIRPPKLKTDDESYN